MRAQRLRKAVEAAGGARTISQKSNIPPSTLHSYLNGQEMKLSQVVALAKATGVRLEWLATGDGPMRPTEFSESRSTFSADEPQSSAVSRPEMPSTETMGAISAAARTIESGTSAAGSIWDAVDFETLVGCFEVMEDLDKMGGGQLKSARSRMRRAFNVYDMKKNDLEP